MFILSEIRQNKHRNTKQNNIATILWVFILFWSALKGLNFGFSFARFDKPLPAITYAQHPTQTEDGKPVLQQNCIRQ